MDMSTDELAKELEELKTQVAVQGATAAGAQATQAATQAGAAATQAAGMAGLASAVGAGAAGFIVGLFMGMAIAKARRS